MERVRRCLIIGNVLLMSAVPKVWAQSTDASTEDPKAVVDNYSAKMISILKGPIAKVFAVIILMACVGALLRGRHMLAVSCGLGFIVLLFLQMLS